MLAGCLQRFSPGPVLSVKLPTVTINEFGGLYPVETWRDFMGRPHYRVNLGGLPFREDSPDKLASLILCCSVDTTINRLLRGLLGAALLLALLWSSFMSEPSSWITITLLVVLILEALVVVRSVLARRMSLKCLLYWGKRVGSPPIMYHPYKEVLTAILENARSCSFPKCRMTISTSLGKYEITRSPLRSVIHARPIGKYRDLPWSPRHRRHA